MNQAIADIQADVATLTDALGAEKTKVDTLIALVEKLQGQVGGGNLTQEETDALASIKASIETATQVVKDESAAVDTALASGAEAPPAGTTSDPAAS